jgi:hypothetical protein
VDDDARSEAGIVIVVVGPPAWVEVRVSIEVDATLELGAYPEAAVPDPEGARYVPLPGTGYGAPDALGAGREAELCSGDTSVEEERLLDIVDEPPLPPFPPSVIVTTLPEPPFPVPCSVTVTTPPEAALVWCSVTVTILAEPPFPPFSVTVTILPLSAACVSVTVMY